MNKSEYSDFYEAEYLPLYFAPWWLDAVCTPDHWNVVLSKNPDGGIEGVWVYHYKKKFGLPVLLMPPLTSYSGLWLNYPKGLKSHSKISFEKKVIDKLLDQIPNNYIFFQQLHSNYVNWLPMQWRAYQQTTRYTYILNLANGLDAIWNNFKGNVRRNVRKAEASGYRTIEIEDFETFWKPLERSYKSRNKAVPFRKEDLQKIDLASSKIERRKMFVTVNEEGKHLSGIYLVYDNISSYYLVGYFDPAFKDYAALTLTLWHGIQEMSKIVKKFDFEGSIIPEIEFYFRAFGGALTPHFKIFKAKNKTIKLLASIKNPKFFE